MPPEQPPKQPEPPEYEERPMRVYYIAMIGFLWRYVKEERERRILLQAITPHKRLERADDEEEENFGLFLNRIMIQNLRAGLDHNLEAKKKEKRIPLSVLLTSLQKNEEMTLEVRGNLAKYIKWFFSFENAVSDELTSKGILATLERIKRPLADQSFINAFNYSGVVQGLDDEVIALLPKSEDSMHPPLYLGMPVFYTKTLPSSVGTGPDFGEGRIVMFFPPTGKIPVHANMVIPSQVIKLEIQTDQGTVHSLFSPKEISLIPPASSKG